MTIHHGLMQARKDDAQRAGDRDRALLEARRAGLTGRPGARLVASATRGARLLSRWTGWAQDRLGKRAMPTAEMRSNPDLLTDRP